MHSLDLLLKAVKCREEGPPRQIRKTRIEIIDIDINCCNKGQFISKANVKLEPKINENIFVFLPHLQKTLKKWSKQIIRAIKD